MSLRSSYSGSHLGLPMQVGGEWTQDGWLKRTTFTMWAASARGALTEQALLQVLWPFFPFDLYNKPVGGLGIDWYAFGCNNEDIYYVNKECRGPQLSFRGLYPNAAHSQSTFDHFLRLSHPLANTNSGCSVVTITAIARLSGQGGRGRFQFCPLLPFGCHWDYLGNNRYLVNAWWGECCPYSMPH